MVHCLHNSITSPTYTPTACQPGDHPPTFFSASQNASAVAGACGAAPPATLAELLARDMLAPLAARGMLAPLGARLSGSASAPVAGSRRGALRLWPSDRSASYSCGAVRWAAEMGRHEKVWLRRNREVCPGPGQRAGAPIQSMLYCRWVLLCNPPAAHLALLLLQIALLRLNLLQLIRIACCGWGKAADSVGRSGTGYQTIVHQLAELPLRAQTDKHEVGAPAAAARSLATNWKASSKLPMRLHESKWPTKQTAPQHSAATIKSSSRAAHAFRKHGCTAPSVHPSTSRFAGNAPVAGGHAQRAAHEAGFVLEAHLAVGQSAAHKL